MLLQNKKLLLLISLGAILEYYDFAIFIYLAKQIGESLIPVENPLVNLILSFAIFAIGAFFRPLGGIIFSHIGDTRGRNKTFIATVLFMALPTLFIGFIPDVKSIGIWATLILIGLRIIQGMAIGGEIPGSVVFGYEIVEAKFRPLASSIVIIGTNVGFIFASLICLLLLNLQFNFALWRIGFILGGIFGIFSYFLRKKLIETPIFDEYNKLIRRETLPLKLLFKHYWLSVVQLLALGAFLASFLAMFTFYMPTYLSLFYHFPLTKLMEFNSYSIFIFIVASLIAGIFHQYFGKKFFVSAILFLVSICLILFPLYAHLKLTQILYIHLVILFVLGILCGRLPVIIAAFFPVSVRYTGIAFVYNISFGIIAGSAQMILSWLIKITGLLWIPALYLGVFALISLIVLFWLKPGQLCNYPD